MNDQKREAMFARAVEALGRVVSAGYLQARGLTDHYLCPICLRTLPRTALHMQDGRRDLTLEDVPPVCFLGPSAHLALTCRWCNNLAGTRWEADLGTHGDALRAGRGAGDLFGTLSSDDIELGGVFHLDQRRIVVHRSKTDPVQFDRLIAKWNRAGGASLQFRSTLKYDPKDAAFALAKSAFVLAFARFGYRWVLDQRVQGIRRLLASQLTGTPSGADLPEEMVLSQSGGDLTTRRLVWMTAPFHAFVVVFGVNAVVLPHPEGPEDLPAALAGLPGAASGDFNIDAGTDLPWPTRMALSVDFGETIA